MHRSLVVVVAILLGGCVERRLLIESDPAGAIAFLDGFPVGRTPVSVEFHHYGTHELLLRYASNGSGKAGETYAPKREWVEVQAPWYQHFPIDFLAEFWPGGIVDEHRVRVTLDRSDPSRELDAFEKRAEERVFPAPPPTDDSSDSSGSSHP
ncbi:MAG: PEGA domain-containing protein [Planctomycetes bacterium]|nr:PEGA domain-containing protein [Planctomycetota bacterium]